MIKLILISLSYCVINHFAQTTKLADETTAIYTNPIIHADYSDPDVIRVGDDYYMTASSFSHFPGLPILHSRDLVHWRLIGHAVQEYPYPEFAKPQHGNAIWAPSIRYHNNEFYIYFGDPDRGVFMTKSRLAEGPWEPLKLIRKVTGWIDCCPFWDDDGNAYLVHAFANSRCGIKSILAVNKMNPEGTVVLDDGVLVFNGQKDHPTIEGPKFYKRNGYYYIFAPAGGVKTGWQTILRSKNIFGPYEDKVTLEQGSTKINGPHQGAWVTTPGGEDWFLHFQDRYAYGRVVHLQPMQWENDWPKMGEDYNKNGIGEPVLLGKLPKEFGKNALFDIQSSDEFDAPALGLQWQWQSNYQRSWYSLHAQPGKLRLYAHTLAGSEKNLWTIGRLLMQKLPAEAFTAETEISLSAADNGTQAGLLMFGLDYAHLAIEKSGSSYRLKLTECKKANKGEDEQEMASISLQEPSVYLRATVQPENPDEIIPKVLCQFSYSVDGKKYHTIGSPFVVREGLWVGAKVGVYCTTTGVDEKSNFADFSYFRFVQ